MALAVEPNGAARHLELFLRQTEGATWSTDDRLLVTSAEGPALARCDLDRERVVGRPIDAVASPESAARHRAVLATGEPQSFSTEYAGRTYDIQLDAVRDRRGRVIGCAGVAVDVTGRVRAAADVRRSYERLEDAQKVAHVGSFDWDVAADRVTWSSEMYRIYGLRPEEFGGTFDAFLSRVHPDDVDAARAGLFEAFRSPGEFEQDHRILKADGAVRLLHTRGAVVADDAGRPIRVNGSCWDVTELDEARRGLERSVSLLHAALEGMFDGLLVVDMEGSVVVSNHRFFAMWQIPTDLQRSGLDEKLIAFVSQQLDDPEVFTSGVRALYEHPERESFDILRFRDGRVFERTSFPQRIGDEVVGRVWSFRDVTDRERLLRRAEFLADAARLLASLDVEHALDGVARLSVPFLGDGCAVDLFGEGGPRRLLSVSRDPAAAMSGDLHPSIIAGHGAIYAVGTTSYMAVPLVVKDAVVGGLTFAAGPGRRYARDDLDLAEELARRAALSVANARLYRAAEEALRARDEFLSIAAHEIRGPLTSIHLAVQAFRRNPDAARADLPKLLEIVEREDRRLARFVEELLDLGRIRAGRLHFRFEEADLAETVRQVVSRLGPELTRSGSSLTVTTEGATLGQWDAFRLDQVVTNLVSNAIKFGLGHPIEVRVEDRGGLAILTVTDHGIGIDPTMHERIFSPFERAVSVRHYGGLGLGLYIVRTIVDGLGGRIAVRSRPGAGATFTVELPIERGR